MMARYFFHLHDGRSIPDREGIELSGREEAWSMATRTYGEIIRDLDGKHRPNFNWSMEVVEGGTQVCWRLHFITESFVEDPRPASAIAAGEPL